MGERGSEWWGSAQAVVSVAAAALGTEIGPLPLSVNVPMHLWDALDPKPDVLLLAHYHALLAAPLGDANPLLDGRAPIAPEAQAWLAERAPLAVDSAAPTRMDRVLDRLA